MQAAVLLGDGVDQRLCRLRIVHIERGAPAAGMAPKERAVILAAPSSVVAVPMTLQPSLGQLERDRGADAAGSAGDQRHLPCKI